MHISLTDCTFNEDIDIKAATLKYSTLEARADNVGRGSEDKRDKEQRSNTNCTLTVAESSRGLLNHVHAHTHTNTHYSCLI